MDVEEEVDFSDLCAEILENWNAPNVADYTRENPFSLRFNGAAYENEFREQDREAAEEIDTILEETEPDYKQAEFDNELARNEDKSMEPPNEKGSKNEPIIPVLIADTFFDKRLDCGVDGIDIQVLKENDDAGASSVSDLNFGQNSYELKCADRIMPKGPPISPGETRCWPCSSSLPKDSGSFLKLRKYYALPSDKTILDVDVDDFEEKLWREPGMDKSNFFNYGLDEKQWKHYCKLVLKAQMQQMEGSLHRSFHESDVIIEVTSSHENELRRKQFNKDEGLRECRFISGDKILPFPMDCYSHDSTADRVHQRTWKNEVIHLTKQTRERKASQNNYNLSTDKYRRITAMNNKYINIVGQMKQHHQESCGIDEMVSRTGSSDMGRQHSFRKQREHPISQVSQSYLNRDWFSRVHQESRHKLDMDLTKCLTFSKAKESVRENLENASLWVKKEYIRGILPSNSHNSDLEVGVERQIRINFKEDPEKLRRRSERFNLPLQISKNSIEDKSMKSPANTFTQQAIGYMDTDINNQHQTRRRRCYQ